MGLLSKSHRIASNVSGNLVIVHLERVHAQVKRTGFWPISNLVIKYRYQDLPKGVCNGLKWHKMEINGTNDFSHSM